MITNKLDSAQLYLDESYRFFSEIGNQSALYYIETQMIELALKKGNVALAGQIIKRSANYGHIDANMINIRNHYLQHYYERVGDYKRLMNIRNTIFNLMILFAMNGFVLALQNWICVIGRIRL